MKLSTCRTVDPKAYTWGWRRV